MKMIYVFSLLFCHSLWAQNPNEINMMAQAQVPATYPPPVVQAPTNPTAAPVGVVPTQQVPATYPPPVVQAPAPAAPAPVQQQVPATYPPAQPQFIAPPPTFVTRPTTTLAPQPPPKPVVRSTTTVAPVAEKKKDSADNELADAFEYPELQVVPRATERLQMESARESDWSSSHLWPFYFSGLFTYYTAMTHAGATESGASAAKITESANATKISQLLGLATVGTAMYFTFSKPAGAGVEKLKYVKASGKRGILQKERMAEESLEDTANKIRKFNWISSFLNLGANAMVFSYAQDNTVRLYAVMGSIFAFFPVMFESPYVSAYEKQIEYKRKIYAPLPSAYINPDPNNAGAGVSLTWSF